MALLMFVALIALILLGVPIAFALISVAFVFGLAEIGNGAVYQFGLKLYDLASNYVIAAIPLFVFMGAVMERSGIANDMFAVINRLLRNVPGGLGVSAVVLCVVFAASSGVSGATEAIVGMLAIPVMQRCKYPNSLISGVICAGGSLGTIIPPSVFVLILAPAAELPVIALFKATVVPGLILAAGYAIYVVIRCAVFHPETIAATRAAGLDADQAAGGGGHLIVQVIKAFVPPVLLIVTVLGSILAGWATTTEAASLGALGALVIAALRGQINVKILNDSAQKTVQVTCMIATILFGGALFSVVFVISGGLDIIESLLSGLDIGPTQTLILVLLVVFVLGFVLDQISMILILIPLSVPLLKSIGIDPIWFSVLFLMVLQTSYLTPPMAPAIFFLKGINPPGITLKDMYKGVVPFIAVQVTAISLVILFPGLIYLWK